MVTLINPQRCKFGIFERYVPLTVPLGIGSLAAFLIQNGEKATIIDEHIELFSL